MSAPRTTVVEKYMCPHCSCYLSKKAYRAHRRLYYDSTTDQWLKKREVETVDCPVEFDDQLDASTSGLSEGPIGIRESDRPPIIDLLDSEEVLTDIEDTNPPGTEDADHLSATNTTSSSETETDGIEVWSEIEDPTIREFEDHLAEPPPDIPQFDHSSSHANALVGWLVYFLLLLQTRFHLADNVLQFVFRFLKVFFGVLGRLSSASSDIAKVFPKSLYQAQKSMGTDTKKFKQFVVCKACHSIYSFQECIEGHGIFQNSKHCSHWPFKNSRHSRSTECGAALLKTVELATGRRIFYPLMVYTYIDLQTSLQHMLLRPEFSIACETWRKRQVPEGTLEDIYDGRVWNDFLFYDGKPFLAEAFSFALLINIDWFQPYQHLSYSVGVIYLTVFNLPRSMRHKLENVCLIGILPGPHEPQYNINSYLDPLIEDLLLFWNGVELSVSPINERKLIRCAVICASCDLPAGRKLCGFLGHSARLGCSKCKKEFPGSVGSMDYSGFNRETWGYRTGNGHRIDAHKLLNCSSKTELLRMESEYGCRYSSILKLPYFNAPRMLTIDPMHNLFLGIAKHYLHKIFIERGILGNSEFDVIQQRVDSMVVPPEIGRIPIKIQSGFASFTADQFKNWVVHYSLIALQGLLSTDQLECWRHFVLACRILTGKVIALDQVKVADALLLQFCRRSERMYGKGAITPNMHMCCHLRDCILDYGPLHSFWVYSFERYNGILGQLPNNNHSIETQMMNRFLRDKACMSLLMPGEFRQDFESLLPFERKQVGSLAASASQPLDQPSNLKWTLDSLQKVELPGHYKRCTLSVSEVDSLKVLYSALYSYPSNSEVYVNSTYSHYSSVLYRDTVLGSDQSRSHSSSIVIAEWSSTLFGTPSESSHELRPVKINFFLKHALTICGEIYTHLLVSVSWFKYHPQKNFCGKPVTVWEPDIYEIPGVHSIIPIQLIKMKTVSLIGTLTIHPESVLFISPFIDFV